MKDTARGFIEIMKSDRTIGEEINIATQKEISIGELAEELIRQINPDAKIVCDNQRLRPKKSEVERLLGNNEKIKRLTEWKPLYTFEEGLAETIEFLKGNLDKYKVGQGWVSTGGAYVEKLEREIAEYAKVSGSVACQSGTAALHMSLIECGVENGDEVIVPTLTFIAAVNPVKYLGAYPVFMDCDDSLCMDPVKLEMFCEEECSLNDGKLIHNCTGRHIKAIIVVHVFGNLADMEKIMDVAGKYHLKVVEDATEAIGTICEYGRYKGKMAGTIGDFGAYSFNGNKIITTGGGGMIVGNNIDKLNHLKYMSTQCKDDSHFYVHNEV